MKESGQKITDIPLGYFGKDKKTVMDPSKFPDKIREDAEIADPSKTAKFAVELDLVPLETNIKNLQSMVQTTGHKL